MTGTNGASSPLMAEISNLQNTQVELIKFMEEIEGNGDDNLASVARRLQKGLEIELKELQAKM